ncbi:MAG: hypothetical protein SFX19_01185 [Alphaproteobacteria bacterium]|nr:hypothetical protein [Alphaproteobacteria bacterium]
MSEGKEKTPLEIAQKLAKNVLQPNVRRQSDFLPEGFDSGKAAEAVHAMFMQFVERRACNLLPAGELYILMLTPDNPAYTRNLSFPYKGELSEANVADLKYALLLMATPELIPDAPPPEPGNPGDVTGAAKAYPINTGASTSLDGSA